MARCPNWLSGRFLQTKTVKTNVDSLIGDYATVTARIHNQEGFGKAVIRGQEWTAAAEKDDEIIEAMKFVSPPPETPVNKSNRAKYTCPVCHVNLWGKPGLVVFCGGEHCEKAELQPS